MLINNNYVVIMFIDCPGATALFSTSAVCDMCIRSDRVVPRGEEKLETQKSFGKSAADTYYLYNII